jgi:Tfp pilus assembly protein PilF
MDFVVEGDRHQDFKFVGTVEQMAASRCYRASREPNKLGCISCHDPHRYPAAEEKVAYYRGRCLQCHTEGSCRLPLAARRQKDKQDSCIACHMPRTGSEVNHASITDHRVPRHAPPPTKAPAGHQLPGPAALVPFPRDLPGLPAEEVSRNLGIALMGVLQLGPPEEVARQFAERALPLLDEALRRDPHDLPAWEAKAAALRTLGRPQEALAAYRAVLSEEPDRETALYDAGKLALLMKQAEAGRADLERAVRLDPWRWESHHLLAADAFERGDWERAARQCTESLRLEPFYSTSRRTLLIGSDLRLGRREQARAEFETLLGLSREDRRPALRRWFDSQQR